MGTIALSQPKFEAEATAAAVGYIVQSLGSGDFHRIFKALYLADVWHLDRFGRMITWEDYAAQKYGPVPMKTYRVMGRMLGDTNGGQDQSLEALLNAKLRVTSKHDVSVREEPDLDELSASDIQCLDEAVEFVRPLKFDDLTELTHDAAWRAANARGMNSRMWLDDLISLSDDAEMLRGHLTETLGHRAG